MGNQESSRRDFLRASALTTALCSFPGLASGAFAQDAKPKAPSALERRRFGKTDMEVTVLGFGGAEIGYQKVEQATVDKLLNAALDAGLNVVDTAECYVDSEIQIGTAIGHRRKEFFLFTKCGHATEATGAG